MNRNQADSKNRGAKAAGQMQSLDSGIEENEMKSINKFFAKVIRFAAWAGLTVSMFAAFLAVIYVFFTFVLGVTL